MKNLPELLFHKLQNLLRIFSKEQEVLLGVDIEFMSMKVITAMYRAEDIDYITYRKYYDIKNILNTLSYTIRDLRILRKKTSNRDLVYNELQFIKEVELFLSKINEANIVNDVCNNINILTFSEPTPMK